MKVYSYPAEYNESKERIVNLPNREETLRVIEGATYRYINTSPKGCQGHLYRVVKFVLDVPSYQDKVLVEALSGPDKGLWFTCTMTNFATRYTPIEKTIESTQERELEVVKSGSGC